MRQWVIPCYIVCTREITGHFLVVSLERGSRRQFEPKSTEAKNAPALAGAFFCANP
jgi:hypothetical protein